MADIFGAAIDFVGSLITTPEEARMMDLQQKTIENQQKSNELRALEAKNAQAIAAAKAKSDQAIAVAQATTAREIASLEAAAQQKIVLVIGGIAVLGITAFTLVSLTRGK